MKKLIVVALMILGLAGVSRAQTCSMVLNSSTETDVFSGSSVINGFSISGGGNGLLAVIPSYGLGAVSIPAGDVTVLGRLTTATGGTVPETGLSLLQSDVNANRAWLHYKAGIVYFDYLHQPHNGVTHIGNQAVSGLDFTLKIIRAGNVITGYIAIDNVNFLSIGSFTVPSAPAGTAALLVDSGDLANVTTATWTGITISGVVPAFVYSHTPSGIPGGLQSGIVTQAGTLYIGQNAINGSVAVTGCGTNLSLRTFNSENVVLNPDTNPTTVISTGAIQGPSTASCESGCLWSTTNPYPGNTPWGPSNLQHGFPYRFYSSTSLQLVNSSGIGVFGIVLPLRSINLNP